jgi:hypothetical protein
VHPAEMGGHPTNGENVPGQLTAEEGFIDRHTHNMQQSQSDDTPPVQQQVAAVATYRDVLFGPEASAHAANIDINTTSL